MKRFIASLFAALLAAQAWAYDFKSGDLYYNITGDNTVEVTYQIYNISGNYPDLTSVEIPETVSYNGITYTVTCIGSSAFNECGSLTSVTIPNSVTIIESSAFARCEKLTSVNIPASVKYIEDTPFFLCSSLVYNEYDNALYLGNSDNPYHALIEVKSDDITTCHIHSNCKVIAGEAFKYCDNLNSVNIPSSVTGIGTWAFYHCGNLTSIDIPETVTDVSNLAFVTVKNINYSGTLQGSPWGACNMNKTPDGDGFIYADDAKTRLTAYVGNAENVTIPESVTEIGYCAFDGCSNLKSVVIPNSVKTISGEVFYNCSNLSSVTIGENVESIGNWAFASCDLTSVDIPESVTDIGMYAFNGVKNINYNGSAEGSPWGAKVQNNFVDENFIYADAEKTRITEYIGEGGVVNIPNAVTTIHRDAFNNGSTITSLGIPSSVTTFDDNVFSGCNNLKSVTINSDADFSKAELYFTHDGIRYHVLGKNKVEVVQNYVDGTNSYSGDVVIPITVGDFTVTSIGNNAFRDCDNLTSISFPEGLETIGEWAFAECDGLTTVAIPSSVTQVGSYDYDAFVGCSKLSAINVEGNNQNYSSVDGVLYNKNQTKIFSYPAGKNGTTYEIPASVTEVGWSSFSGCNKLESVTIPDGVNYLGGNAFNNCSNLKSVNIPEYIEIHDETFAGCENLTLTVPETVTFYEGPYSQNNCFQGVKKVVYEGTVAGKAYGAEEAVAEFVLDGSKLVWYNGQGGTVSIPEGVTAIGNDVFRDNSDITAVYIPEGVETIGDAAFASCSNLQYVNIPKTVTSISGYAFRDCDKLPSINVAADNPNFTSVDGVLFSKDEKTLICYPAGKTATSYEIPNGVETINWCSFSGCNNLKSVTIPEGVKKIWGWAFEDCTGLTEITIPSTVETIGSKAFMNCSNLSKVILLSENTTYEDDAFEGIELPTIEYKNPNNEEEYLTYEVRDGAAVVTGYKSNIPETLTIPSTVTIDGVEYEVKGIDKNAFNNCENLKSVTIGNSVGSIGENAFSGCTNLESITIESDADFSKAGLYFTQNGIRYHVLNKDEVEIVAEYYEEHEDGSVSFNQNILSGDLVIPESIMIGQNYAVKNIGPYAFGGAITSVTIPNSVTNIGANAFSSCIDLKSATLGNSVETIGNSAFNGCKNLETVNMGNSVKNIGNDAFRATNINDIIIPSSVTNIGGWAFAECHNLETIDIPSSVETVGDYAFAYCSNLAKAVYNPETTTIGETAFLGTKVNLQQGNEEEEYVLRYEIRDGAVIVSGYNSNIPENLTIPSTVTIDGVEYAVTGIRENAFYGCDKLKSIEISEGIETVGDKAFSGCKNLESISIPSSVNNFGGWDVFESCEKVKTLTYNTDALDLRYVNKLPLETVVIGESVTKIQSSGFYDCSSLKSVTIGNSVETIGGYAFNNCTGLTSIEIPESVKEIGKNAFSNCTGLTSIEIPKSVKTVGDYAFANCSNLANVDYNPSTTTFGKGAFEGTKIEPQQGTEEGYELTYVIRDGAAVVTGYNGTISGDVTIPSTLTINGTKYTVKGIDNNAFSNCTKLTSVTIPNSVESIGSKAFYNCTGLGSLTIPKSVTSIGTDAFNGVNNVVNMSKIPDGQWGAASIFTLRHDTVRMQITETKIEYIHDTIFMFRTVAVNDMSANLSIYPNPTTSFVTVKGERKFSYILANSTGAALRRGDGSDMYVVDLSDYADGIYLLYTSDGELYKIIKE